MEKESDDDVVPALSESFEELLAKARAAYGALTPEEKKAHDRAQRISWAYGQVKLAGSSLTYEQVEKIADEYFRKMDEDFDRRIAEVEEHDARFFVEDAQVSIDGTEFRALGSCLVEDDEEL